MLPLNAFAQANTEGAPYVWPETAGWYFRCKGLPCTDDDVAFSKDQLSAELMSASDWYASLGFRAPSINTTVRGDGTSSQAQYVAEFVDEIEDKNGVAALGAMSLDGELRLDLDFVLATNQRRAAHAHEIFHAIQNSYQRSKLASVTLDWIAEGTADAAAIQWIINDAKNIPHVDAQNELSSLTINDNRAFDVPLYEGDTYGTSIFWRRVGTDLLNSAGGIGYLDTIFQQSIVAGGVDKHGLNGVHDGFKALASRHEIEGLGHGLYYVFPWFITTPDLGYTSANIVREPLQLPLGKTLTELEIMGTVKPVAANVIELAVDANGDNPYTVEIRLVSENQLQDDDLHLIVQRELYSFPDDRDDRNVATIHGVEDEEKITIRVANIAKRPSESSPLRYRLEIKLIRFELCGPKRSSLNESLGVDQTTSIQRIEGTMIASGHASGEGVICSDVMDGVPVLTSNIASNSVDGKRARFTVHTPPTATVNLRGIEFPQHNGNEGWPANTSYEVAFDIDGLDFSDLREGETYPVKARLSYQTWDGELTSAGGNAPSGDPMYFLDGIREFAQAGWGTGLTGTITIDEVYRAQPENSPKIGGHRVLAMTFDVSGEEAGSDLVARVIQRNDGVIYEDTESESVPNLDVFPFALRGTIALPCLTRSCDEIPLVPVSLEQSNEEEEEDDADTGGDSPSSGGSSGASSSSGGSASSSSSSSNGPSFENSCDCQCSSQWSEKDIAACIPICNPVWELICPLE